MNWQAFPPPCSSPRRRTAHLGLVGAIALTLYSYSAPAPAQPLPGEAESDQLFYEGNALMLAGKTAAACEKFDASLALQRRGGTLYNLAVCREELGQLLLALQLFEESLAVALRDERQERADSSRQNIASLRQRLAWVTFTFAAGAPAQASLEIRVNGVAVPPAEQSTAVPVMPGAYLVSISAPGKQRFEVRVTGAKAGETHEVEIPVLLDSAPAPRASPEVKPRSPEIPRPDTAGANNLSHAWQLGAIVRVDLDPFHSGARTVLGLTFGLGDHFEIGASALLGPVVGIEPQLTFFFVGRGALKPLLNVGAPVFLADGTQVGMRGSAGLAWDPFRQVGVFAMVGGAYFPYAPVWIERALFLPTAGVQGRW